MQNSPNTTPHPPCKIKDARRLLRLGQMIPDVWIKSLRGSDLGKAGRRQLVTFCLMMVVVARLAAYKCPFVIFPTGAIR